MSVARGEGSVMRGDVCYNLVLYAQKNVEPKSVS